MELLGYVPWIAFPTLLILGWVREALGVTSIAVFIAIALAAWFGIPRVAPYAGALMTPALALLDVALVLMVNRGDVRVT